ncbi:MAG TPA: O-antigen ligase family protein [Longimicrobiales bacterium]
MAEPGTPEAGVRETKPPPAAVVPAEPGRAERRALRVLQLGALAAVLVAMTWKQFELDRFFVPKELVLHATAFTGGMLALRAIGRLRFTRVDLLLIGFLILSAASAVGAANGWAAVRALALTASGVVIFWTARALRAAGLDRPLLGALAAAVVLGCVTSLLQTYGVRTEFFSLNRAPGGTLGNRNFIAHMAAFGLPIVLFVSMRAVGRVGWLSAGLGATLVAGTLVLTRSRAGFLAFAAVLGVVCIALMISPALRSHGRAWRRLAGLVLLATAGIAAAVKLPNSLNWRSENPYVESLTGVANFQEGSGRGRLVQYRQSLRMAVDNPLLGVGPGNWGVRYADYAARGDPSLDRSEPGMTSNPWPSSDWIALVSERGFVAGALLGLALVGIGVTAVRDILRSHDADGALAATTLVAVLVATAVAGMFDAVLLLAQPTLLMWGAAGALWTGGASPVADESAAPSLRRGRMSTTAQLVVVAGVLFICGVGVLRGAAQLAGMGIYANTESTGWLERAALVDPGNYRIRLRLARPGGGLERAKRCEHARAASALQPNAREARNLADGC